MDTTVWALVVGSASGFTIITGAVGVAWRVILPWLRKEILAPVHTTNEQVTNSHASNLRDDLTEIKDQVSEQGEMLVNHGEKQCQIERLLIEHIEESRERDRRISRLEAQKKSRLFPFAL